MITINLYNKNQRFLSINVRKTLFGFSILGKFFSITSGNHGFPGFENEVFKTFIYMQRYINIQISILNYREKEGFKQKWLQQQTL